ncbi:Stabilin-2 [Madurella mycetomatis]|uniref:Stabilin-2 n=1 Tax=Madurella mycetomatis TaxID=100816 RepID=A0A175W6A7_9PEZI|nr:Stabilin-2 [Madurella mycetomatis]
MKPAIFLFVATAVALVAPREARPQQSIVDKAEVHDAVQTWWDAFPSVGGIFSSIEERITTSIDGSIIDTFLRLASSVDDDEEEEEEGFHPPHHRHGRRGDPSKTIYELIKECKHTTKFAKLVDDHDEIKQLLQDTEHNHTLFVPTDRAFKRIPHHGHKDKDKNKDGDGDNDDDDDHKPPKEFLLALLRYHLVPGSYSRHRILFTQTLPTEFTSPALSRDDDDDDDDGDDRHDSTHHHHHPQRLHIDTTPLLRRIRLNFYSRVRVSDVVAKNGLIHAIDAPLFPPPPQTTILRAMPSIFSTFALALERTGVAAELEDEGSSRVGGTVFAPSNHAWALLGPKLNGFLFSEPGRKYLRALVRYHVVGNETLYSDAYYRRKGGDGEGGEEEGVEGGGGYGYWHVDLPTWLHEKPVSVDIRRWKGFVSMVVNGGVRAVVRDGVAHDGVIHIVNRVLIPPTPIPRWARG